MCTLVPRITDFLYVCQFVHCLTSLPKLNYLWISSALDEICFQLFLRNFSDASTLVLHDFRFLSETFRRHSLNVCKLNQNEFIVLVCLSICFNLDSAGLNLAACEFLCLLRSTLRPLVLFSLHLFHNFTPEGTFKFSPFQSRWISVKTSWSVANNYYLQ